MALNFTIERQITANTGEPEVRRDTRPGGRAKPFCVSDRRGDEGKWSLELNAPD